MTKAVLTIALLTLTISTVCTCQPAHAGGYLLRYKYNVGDVATYKLTMENSTDMGGAAPGGAAGMMGAGTVTHMDSICTAKVVGIRASDGAAELQTSIVMTDMTVNGRDMTSVGRSTISHMPVITNYINDRGDLVGTDAPSAANGPRSMPGMSLNGGNFTMTGCALPDAPVNPGDTWSGKMAGFGSSMVAQSTLQSVAPGVGGTIAHFVTQASGNMDAPGGAAKIAGPIKTTSDILFNVDLGRMESSSSTSDSTMSMPMPGGSGGAPMTMHMIIKMTMTRIDNP